MLLFFVRRATASSRRSDWSGWHSGSQSPGRRLNTVLAWARRRYASGSQSWQDVRLTPRDELSKQQATLVIWSSPNEAAHFSGCRALLGPPADCLETTLSGASSPQQLVRSEGLEATSL